MCMCSSLYAIVSGAETERLDFSLWSRDQNYDYRKILFATIFTIIVILVAVPAYMTDLERKKNKSVEIWAGFDPGAPDL